jgi:predicted nucleic acid-binding protein
MPSSLYDTRFFFEYFYSADSGLKPRAKESISRNKERYVSAVTLHELYLLDLQKRGREIARLSLQTVRDLFRIADVNSEIAINAAELRNRYKIPMGDSLIAATCRVVGAQCVTDDPHITKIKEIKTCWF